MKQGIYIYLCCDLSFSFVQSYVYKAQGCTLRNEVYICVVTWVSALYNPLSTGLNLKKTSEVNWYSQNAQT